MTQMTLTLAFATELASAAVPWWSAEAGNAIGVIGGGVLGVVGGGGIGGLAVPLLANRGRHKSVAIGLMLGVAVAGAGSLVAGMVALLMRQPYGVWYPLVLSGALASGLFGGLIPVILARYRTAERRAVQADLIRGAAPAAAPRAINPGVLGLTAGAIALGLYGLVVTISAVFAG